MTLIWVLVLFSSAKGFSRWYSMILTNSVTHAASQSFRITGIFGWRFGFWLTLKLSKAAGLINECTL